MRHCSGQPVPESEAHSQGFACVSDRHSVRQGVPETTRRSGCGGRARGDRFLPMSTSYTPETGYHPDVIEAKWQARWADRATNQPDLDGAAKPFYNLMMFPYPSAEGLHVGNFFAFTGAD